MTAPTAPASVASRPSRLPVVRRYAGELARFGSVGAVAYVVDVGLFNLLRYGPGEVLGAKPLTAKVIAAAVATLVAWVGNRYWTFRHQKTSTPVRELIGFFVVNGLGMLAAVGCLAFSHYVLGLTSALADNVAGNIVGTGVGTIIRYVAYRNFVFTGHKRADVEPLPTGAQD